MVDSIDSELERKEFQDLVSGTPVGGSFDWKGERRLVHETECGRRYTTKESVMLMPQEAA